MKSRLALICILAVLILISAFACYGQNATGTPPFGSYGGGPDVINLANLNSQLTIPVLHKPGRGLDFVYDLGYNSYVWTPSSSSGNAVWAPSDNWGWFVAGTGPVTGYVNAGWAPTYKKYCQNADGGYQWESYRQQKVYGYTDARGTFHSIPFTLIYPITSGDPCSLDNEEVVATATDGSNWTIDVWLQASSTTATATSTTGMVLIPPVATLLNPASVTDRNGNKITTSNGTTFYDTLSSTTPVLSWSGSGTPSSPVVYTYTAPSGASAHLSVNYTNYTVATNFGVSGITEYKSSAAVPLVSSISLPDGSQYTFTYEATPSTPSSGACTPYSGTTCVTARLASVHLPTGGTISYTYSGGNNGILPDGTVATLTRTTPDGTWTYAQVKGSYQWSNTTITDPQNNQSVLVFQGIFEAQRNIYQGSSTSGTLLKTIMTCYNHSGNECNIIDYTLPFTQRSVYVQWPGTNGLQSQVTTFYNSNGLPTETDEYAYGAGVPGSLVRKTLTTYAGLGNGIVNMPASVTVQDGSGNTKAKTTYTYDQGTVVATSGTPQHTSITGSRGNLTSVNSYTSSSGYLTKSMSYYDTGNVYMATDTNNAQTTYTYGSGSCGNSFPTSVSEPLNLSKSVTWNCTGGVMTSATDENGKTVTSDYSTDPYFWRPDYVNDQLYNQTTFTYNGQTSVESSLSFGNSIVDSLATYDSLGRSHITQQKQGPSLSTYDSTETDYDSLGRPYRTSVPYSGNSGQTYSGQVWASTTYDALGRTATVTDGGGGTTSYTYVQNDTYRTVGPAPSGENTKQRQFEYDALGRLTSVCEVTGATGSGTCGQTSTATGYWTQYTYDAANRLTGVTQNAQSTQHQTRTYAYDYLGRMTSETNPESGTTTYVYDSDSACGTSRGDLVKKADAVGNTTCITYDVLHRITSTTYGGPYSSSTPAKHFVYDAATVNGVAMTNVKGQLAEAYTGSSGSKITDLGFSYTARGETSDVYQSTPHSGGYYHLTQTYWQHGEAKQLSGLSSLPAITYGGTIGSTVGLDGEGRITQVTAGSGQNPVTNVVYNPYGTPPQTTVTFGSGDSDVFNYDANTGRMAQYQFNVNDQSDTGALSWNANSTLRQLAISDALPSSTDSQTCAYGYDDLTRIASANCGAAANQTFSYDPFGNISKSGSPYSFQPTYNTATNRITTTGYSYDANGNILADPVHSYAWDANGKSVTVDGVGVTYDALGRAVEQNKSGAYAQMVYTPGGAKLAIMSGQTTLQKAFVPLPGQATAIYTGTGLDHYRHSDWLGNARLTSSPTRTVASTTAYAPFGETYAQSGTADPSFTGMNQDTTSGDYDFPAREYNSVQGRWASPDPSGIAAVNPMAPQSWNRYAYVLDNPLALTDPNGLWCVWGDGSHDDDESNGGAGPGECADNGGYWDPTDTITGAYEDPNSNWVRFTAYDGSTVIACFTGDCTQQQLNLFQQALNNNANAVAFAQAFNNTGIQSLNNPCTIVAWFGSSALAAPLGATDAEGEAVFPAANETMAAAKASPLGKAIIKSAPYVAVAAAGAKFTHLLDQASDWVTNKVRQGCNALQ